MMVAMHSLDIGMEYMNHWMEKVGEVMEIFGVVTVDEEMEESI